MVVPYIVALFVGTPLGNVDKKTPARLFIRSREDGNRRCERSEQAVGGGKVLTHSFIQCREDGNRCCPVLGTSDTRGKSVSALFYPVPSIRQRRDLLRGILW